MASRKYWTVVPYHAVRRLPSLKISPAGVVPQRNRRPRTIIDYTFSGVGPATLQVASPHAMQFGSAFQRVIEPPNPLEKTGEDEFEKETNSKTIAPVDDTIKVTKDRAINDMDPTIKETEENAIVQLTSEDLRISRLSGEELGKESLAFMNEGRFEEAKNLYERHRKLKQK